MYQNLKIISVIPLILNKSITLLVFIRCETFIIFLSFLQLGSVKLIEITIEKIKLIQKRLKTAQNRQKICADH